MNTELAALIAERDTLKAEVERLWMEYTKNYVKREQYEFAIEKCRELTAARDAAVAGLGEAVGLLEPLAQFMKLLEDREDTHRITRISRTKEDGHYEATLTVGDCRRAAAFLARHKGGT